MPAPNWEVLVVFTDLGGVERSKTSVGKSDQQTLKTDSSTVSKKELIRYRNVEPARSPFGIRSYVSSSSQHMVGLLYIDCNVENLIDLPFDVINHIAVGDCENALLAAGFDNQVGCVAIWNVAPSEFIKRDRLL